MIALFHCLFVYFFVYPFLVLIQGVSKTQTSDPKKSDPLGVSKTQTLRKVENSN